MSDCRIVISLVRINYQIFRLIAEILLHDSYRSRDDVLCSEFNELVRDRLRFSRTAAIQ